METYPPIAFKLVKQTMEETNSKDFETVFMALQEVIQREKGKSPFSYMNDKMKVFHCSDIMKIIQKIEEQGFTFNE